MPLLRFEHVTKSYPLPRPHLFAKRSTALALQGASFELHRGEILGIVGESGSGKSTLARLAMGFETPTSGKITAFDQEINSYQDMNLIREKIQMIFQDPYASLDPRKSIGWSIGQPLRAQGKTASEAEISAMLTRVGLSPEQTLRKPRAFSGGQRQRIAIARALIGNPEIVIADEAVSALDVSVQAQILNLLLDLQEERAMSMIFISHDLRVVGAICDRILVLKSGQIVEQGEISDIIRNPQHPYTKSLLAAADL